MSESTSQFVVGAFLGALVAFMTASLVSDMGRYDCEASLPRTEKCVSVWIPEPKETK